jgi:hypothetical protein
LTIFLFEKYEKDNIIKISELPKSLGGKEGRFEKQKKHISLSSERIVDSFLLWPLIRMSK